MTRGPLYFEVYNSFFQDQFNDDDKLKEMGIVNPSVLALSKSIEAMAHCDALFVVEGFERARGCLIEHSVAIQYGLQVIYGGVAPNYSSV